MLCECLPLCGRSNLLLVLILVLMEDALRDLSNNLSEQVAAVLILVLMEDALREKYNTFI